MKTLVPSCSLTEVELTKRKKEIKKGLFSKVSETKELPEGYDFIFRDQALIQDILEFISFERSCCADFYFAMEFEPNQGPVHLKIYGSKAVKEQIKNML